MERDEDWILPAILIAGATVLCTVLLSVATGYPARPNRMTSLKVAVIVITVTALWRFLRYLFQLWRSGVDHPIARIGNDFRPALIDFAPILAGVSIIAVFLYSITFSKSMITAVVPFWADAPLAAIDRAMALDPTAIAIALGPSLVAFGFFYGLWHAAHLGGILWVLHWRGEVRGRFILSFMLTWAIGMFLAFVFSSAGPIFTGTYQWSVAPESVQKPATILWANYQAKGALLGAGISAFPSMHVAIATWFALALKEKGLPMIGLAYLLAIYFCSVILGWHYAADGAAGVAVALLAHRLSQTWLNARRARAAPTGAPAPVSS